MKVTKISSKFQTTARKIKIPLKFLTSQIKLNIDAVKLTKEAREEFK